MTTTLQNMLKLAASNEFLIRSLGAAIGMLLVCQMAFGPTFIESLELSLLRPTLQGCLEILSAVGIGLLASVLVRCCIERVESRDTPQSSWTRALERIVISPLFRTQAETPSFINFRSVAYGYVCRQLNRNPGQLTPHERRAVNELVLQGRPLARGYWLSECCAGFVEVLLAYCVLCFVAVVLVAAASGNLLSSSAGGACLLITAVTAACLFILRCIRERQSELEGLSLAEFITSRPQPALARASTPAT